MECDYSRLLTIANELSLAHKVELLLHHCLTQKAPLITPEPTLVRTPSSPERKEAQDVEEVKDNIINSFNSGSVVQVQPISPEADSQATLGTDQTQTSFTESHSPFSLNKTV